MSGVLLTVCSSARVSAVLADTGDQPRLVLALRTFHVPAFAEHFALVETRGFRHAAEGQRGDGLVGAIIHTFQLYAQVVDVGRLERIAQVGAFALEELQ